MDFNGHYTVRPANSKVVCVNDCHSGGYKNICQPAIDIDSYQLLVQAGDSTVRKS